MTEPTLGTDVAGIVRLAKKLEELRRKASCSMSGNDAVNAILPILHDLANMRTAEDDRGPMHVNRLGPAVMELVAATDDLKPFLEAVPMGEQGSKARERLFKARGVFK